MEALRFGFGQSPHQKFAAHFRGKYWWLVWPVFIVAYMVALVGVLYVAGLLRGLAAPLLMLVGATWYWFRKPGSMSEGEQIAFRALVIALAFFLLGPFLIPTFRLVALALGTVAWFVFKPIRGGL